MSGGRAFVWDKDGDFPMRCNQEMVDLERLVDREDLDLVRDLLIQHAAYTGSAVVARLLKKWKSTAAKFVKVMPRDYRRVLDEQKEAARSLPSVAVLQTMEVSHG